MKPAATDGWGNPRRRLLVYGLLHSAFMLLAFPPLSWWWCTFFAVAVLVHAATRAHAVTFKAAMFLWLGAIPYWAYTEWWISDVSLPGYPFLVAIEAFWPACFVWLLSRVNSRLPMLPVFATAPFLWTGIEFLRGELFANGYAWSLIAYPLIDRPEIAWAAPLGGVYAVGLLVAALAAASVDVCRGARRRWLGLTISILLSVGCTTYGYFLYGHPQTSNRTVKPAVVQTNVPQSNKLDWTVERELADWKRFEDLSTLASQSHPDFIVWPETMMPGLTLEPDALSILDKEGIVFPVKIAGQEEKLPATAFADRLKVVQSGLGVPMVIGEDAIEGFRVVAEGSRLRFEHDRRFNSVYLVSNGNTTADRYDKVRLTPFGETMPYISSWPWLQTQLLAIGAHGMKFDLAQGSRDTAFSIPIGPGREPVRFVTPICFEVTVAPHCRKLVYASDGTRRADIIVNLTNDGWFGSFDTAREQHLQIARWRCLELATPMVRAANTGVSVFVDSTGKVQRRMEGGSGGARTDGFLLDTLALPASTTIYGRSGDVVGWSALAILCVLVISTCKPKTSAPA